MRYIAGDILDTLEKELTARSVPSTNKPVYTKSAILNLYRDELLYDIKQIAFVEGDIIETEDEHERHQIIDIAEDGNIDIISRRMNRAASHCNELMYPYSKVIVGDVTTTDNEAENFADFIYDIKIPDDFSQTTVDHLTKLIHDYIVYDALYYWMSITNLRNTNSAVKWASLLQSLQDEIASTLFARMRRVRRTQTPF